MLLMHIFALIQQHFVAGVDDPYLIPLNTKIDYFINDVCMPIK